MLAKARGNNTIRPDPEGVFTMKKNLAALFLLILFSACPGSPKIFFEKTTHDFGELKQGVKISYTFVFQNRGEGMLKIGKIESG